MTTQGARAADRVIARIDASDTPQRGSAEESLLSCHESRIVRQALTEAPTEAERAVDKHWPKYFAEWAKLQQAANGIAVKPHDCFENLSAQLVCSVCGAAWVEQKIGG